MTKKTIDISSPFKVPSEIAVCGYCDAELWVMDIDECNCDASGVCTDVQSIHTECDTEPDFDDPAWDDWSDSHLDMPYVNILPQEIKILEWLNSGQVTLVDNSIERKRLEQWTKANKT